MTKDEWDSCCSSVVDKMLAYVRPFVAPLSNETEHDVRLIGTGTFVDGAAGATILTCEHVVREGPLNYRPFGDDKVFAYRGDWITRRDPVDAAWTSSPITLPKMMVHSDQIATKHHLVRPEELLFFFGYSGENSTYAFDTHNTNGCGYLTQMNQNAVSESGDIELLWPNGEQKWSDKTTDEARNSIRFNDPAGFSGSLVWNTRFLEAGADLGKWEPKMARATAVLKRFVPEDNVLLATPIEALSDLKRHAPNS